MLKAKVEVSVQTVTPEQAEFWLQFNKMNRPMVGRRIAGYAKAMADGRWKLNGETIIFSSDGTLLNGQHRLKACVISDSSFETVVVTGIDSGAFDTMDDVRKRTGSDVLAIKGFTHTAALAGSVRWVVAIRNAVWSISGVRLSNDEISKFIEREPDLEGSVKVVYPARKIIAPSPSAALHYLFCEKDRELADAFFRDLSDGSGLSSSDPVWVLRERLIRDRLQKSKLAIEEIVLMCIRAWNRRRSNESSSIVKGSISREGAKKTYPKIA